MAGLYPIVGWLGENEIKANLSQNWSFSLGLAVNVLRNAWNVKMFRQPAARAASFSQLWLQVLKNEYSLSNN